MLSRAREQFRLEKLPQSRSLIKGSPSAASLPARNFFSPRNQFRSAKGAVY